MEEELPEHPRLADGLELVAGPGESLQLRGCTPPLRLTGRMPHRLLPLLDGSHSLDAITAALVNDWPRSEVLAAVGMLAARGLVSGDAPAVESPVDARAQAAFYWAASTGAADRGEQARQAVQGARLHLCGWGRLLQEIDRHLCECKAEGLTVESWLPPAGVLTAAPAAERTVVPFPAPDQFQERYPARSQSDLVVLALPRPAPALLAAANAASIRQGVPLLPIVISGVEAIMGPAVLPGRSACYACFKQRLKTNASSPDDDEAYDAHLDGRPAASSVLPDWPPFTAAIAALAAMEAVRLVTRFTQPVTAGHAVFFDGLSGNHRISRVWKLPRCKECMGAGSRGGEPDGSQPGTDA